MILKIETHHIIHNPSAEAPNPPVKDGINKRKLFTLIDHVDQITHGEIAHGADFPMSTIFGDGRVREVEVYDDDEYAGEEPKNRVFNLIRIHQGDEQRTIAAAHNVYLCNDRGDTVEVIRGLN
jgi:hypothetical protein